MITDIGRPNRSARASSSRSSAAKCRALKSPVFESTRASSSSAGTFSDRWMRMSGATAAMISQRFASQSVARATPRKARISPWRDSRA